MKAVMNGVPNLSILDGWWPEACRHGINGWGIGNKEDSRDDDRDANALYDLLEDEVLPAWKSSRDRWLSIMRSAIIAGSGFTGQRMIREYENIYETFGI